MAVEVGQVPPDFSLQDWTRTPHRLSEYRGQGPVVVAFYVLAFTGG